MMKAHNLPLLAIFLISLFTCQSSNILTAQEGSTPPSSTEETKTLHEITFVVEETVDKVSVLITGRDHILKLTPRSDGNQEASVKLEKGKYEVNVYEKGKLKCTKSFKASEPETIGFPCDDDALYAITFVVGSTGGKIELSGLEKFMMPKALSLKQRSDGKKEAVVNLKKGRYEAKVYEKGQLECIEPFTVDKSKTVEIPGKETKYVITFVVGGTVDKVAISGERNLVLTKRSDGNKEALINLKKGNYEVQVFEKGQQKCKKSFSADKSKTIEFPCK